jgi:hypothetical protein
MIKYRAYIEKVDEPIRYIDVASPKEGMEIVLNNKGGHRVEAVGIEELDTETDNDWTEWSFEHDGYAWDSGSLTLVNGKIEILKVGQNG